MPVLKFKHVVSFSSEDSKHPASNILKPETYFKWKCASGQERHASIILQLEQTSHIHAIDIGNNGSAFIEVLVGRSSWGPDEEFKVLLVASSFMSPVESKSGKELNRVRMFGNENLSNNVATEQWDQVKIVCTQPYNQSEGYGLSFITIHAPEKKDETKQEKTVQLGRFKLKSNSDDESSDISAGSFFQKRMNLSIDNKQLPKPSLAATARSTDSPKSSQVFKTKAEPSHSSKKISVSSDRRQEVVSALMRGSPVPSKTSVSSETENKPKNITTPIVKRYKPEETPKRKSESKSGDTLEQPSKKVKGEIKQKKVKLKKKNVPYSRILEGVTFALSGYQNPERGNIRDLGLSLGAKYEPAWNHKCSHLICAFANTPKFTQVKGKGKIVKKGWFDECHKRRRRTNTKSFRIDGGGDSSFESSSSDSDLQALPRDRVDPLHSPAREDESSECDTEDELEKLRAKSVENDQKPVPVDNKNKANSKIHVDKNTEDLYGGTTEDEEDAEITDVDNALVKQEDLPELPDFFGGKTFLLYGDFERRDRRLLVRYITAYGGTIEEYMTDSVNYVISEANWDTNFKKAKADNETLIFIRPKWIMKCHEKQKLVSHEKYIIAPA